MIQVSRFLAMGRGLVEHMEQLEAKKKSMIDLLTQMTPVIDACKKAGIGRTTHYNWLKNDPEYKESVDSIQDHRLDQAERRLDELIAAKNPTAIIFFLKTKGKKRGYVERQEVQEVKREEMTEEEALKALERLKLVNDKYD